MIGRVAGTVSSSGLVIVHVQVRVKTEAVEAFRAALQRTVTGLFRESLSW